MITFVEASMAGPTRPCSRPFPLSQSEIVSLFGWTLFCGELPEHFLATHQIIFLLLAWLHFLEVFGLLLLELSQFVCDVYFRQRQRYNQAIIDGPKSGTIKERQMRIRMLSGPAFPER
jgi:hypothetical protein